MLEILEPINIWVLFKKPARPAGGNLIQPTYFFWRGRQIKVEKVNLVHTSKNGDEIFYHFSVSSEGNFYRLRFDSSNMNWFLEAVESD